MRSRDSAQPVEAKQGESIENGSTRHQGKHYNPPPAKNLTRTTKKMP